MKRVVCLESVTKNETRSGIECFVIDKRLSASFNGCAEVRCFRKRECATMINHDLHHQDKHVIR